MKSKRPWKNRAEIMRVELNNGDVKYEVYFGTRGQPVRETLTREQGSTFETLAEAEAEIDTWWLTQPKIRRRV